MNTKPNLKETKKSLIEVSPQKEKIYYEGVVTDNTSEETKVFNQYSTEFAGD